MTHYIRTSARFSICLAWMISTMILALGANGLSAAELSVADKETARHAESLLKQVETNLKLAQDTAGPGTAALTGAKAKLAAVRLQPAKDALPAAIERIKKLPADNAEVIALQKRADAAGTAISTLQTRIDGKPTQPMPTDQPPTIKLDYKQDESLKNVRFYLREIEGQSGAVAKVVTDITPIEDKTKIDHRLIQQAINSIAFSRQRSELVANHMKNLPANGTGVTAVAEGWKAAMASIDANEKVLAPIHKQLSELVSPASYPQFESDYKRISELAKQYGDVQLFSVNREQAATLFQQAPAAKEEVDRVSKSYAILMHQRTEQGERLTKMRAYFAEQFAAFTTAADEQKKSLPAEIRGHLAEVNRMADEAVAQEKPAFFGGGIPQVLGSADEKLALYSALAPDESKAIAAELAKTRLDLQAKQKSLHNAIIAANTLPPDRYTGADREQIIALATETWKKQQPDAVVMTVRIPSEKWTRNTLWRYQNKSWYLIDSSSLQAQLLVKHAGDLAVIRPINLSINHLAGDKLSAGAMDDIKDELIPQRLLPQAKVK